MELKTLFKRENVADPLSIRIRRKKYRLLHIYLIVAQALFRATDPKLAGWKTGSRISVGLKMAKC
jgi:hypothetical protein